MNNGLVLFYMVSEHSISKNLFIEQLILCGVIKLIKPRILERDNEDNRYLSSACPFAFFFLPPLTTPELMCYFLADYLLTII